MAIEASTLGIAAAILTKSHGKGIANASDRFVCMPEFLAEKFVSDLKKIL